MNTPLQSAGTPYPLFKKKNPYITPAVITLIVLFLIGASLFCMRNFLDYKQHYPEYLADNAKVNRYVETLTKAVEGRDKATVLAYCRSHGIRSQVNFDESIDCFPGRAATSTTRFYLDRVHIERNPDGKYWSFSFHYGGASLFGF